MNDSQDPMEIMKQRMAEHAKTFATQLPDRHAAIASAFQRYQAESTEANLDEASRLAHSLAGAAAIFGFPEVGARAKALELALYDAKQGNIRSDLPDLVKQIEQIIRQAV